MNNFKKVFSLILFIFLLVHCSDRSVNNHSAKKTKKENCCSKESSTKNSETSEITCPKCGYKKIETLPTDVCVIKYTCKNCEVELTPKLGDCCVFCTHGTHKCPSMQDDDSE